MLPLDKIRPSPLHPPEVGIGSVFSSEHTSSADTFFQFCYFVLMVVTELQRDEGSSKAEVAPLTQDSFLKRVKDFDPKFVAQQR